MAVWSAKLSQWTCRALMDNRMSDQTIKFTDGAAYERGMGTWSRLAGEVFIEWLAPSDGLRWIDVGCGNGALARQLSAAGFVTRGCDADREGIEQASLAGGDFFVASVYDDPGSLGDQSYDAVISTEVIEHLFSPHRLPEFAFPLLKSLFFPL